MGMRGNFEKKMQQMLGGNVELNKKALKIKRSLDDVDKVLNTLGKKESKKTEKK